MLQASALEVGTYQWNGPQNYTTMEDHAIISEVTQVQAGRYEVQFTNYLGCRIDTFTEVVIHPEPTPDLGPDTSLCLLSPELLYPGDFFSYQWQDGSTTNYLSIEDYGSYWVNVVNEFGCGGTDSILISNGCPAQVYVPNAFSPNEDGTNDMLFAYALQVMQFRMQVFNRWGDLVFKSNDFTQGWDGTFRGKAAEAGIYAYFIEATFLNGQSIRKSGDVMLIR